MLNFSLVKVSGIPITLFILFKIALIIGLTFWFSLFVRRSIVTFASSRAYISTPPSTACQAWPII